MNERSKNNGVKIIDLCLKVSVYYLIGFFVTVIYESPFLRLQIIPHQRHKHNAAFRSTAPVLELRADLIRDRNMVTKDLPPSDLIILLRSAN